MPYNTVLDVFVTTRNGKEMHCYESIVVPEPYQHHEPKDICVYTGKGKWAVRRRMSICPFTLPSEFSW